MCMKEKGKKRRRWKFCVGVDLAKIMINVSIIDNVECPYATMCMSAVQCNALSSKYIG